MKTIDGYAQNHSGRAGGRSSVKIRRWGGPGLNVKKVSLCFTWRMVYGIRKLCC